jgi:hypothetical protein
MDRHDAILLNALCMLESSTTEWFKHPKKSKRCPCIRSDKPLLFLKRYQKNPGLTWPYALRRIRGGREPGVSFGFIDQSGCADMLHPDSIGHGAKLLERPVNFLRHSLIDLQRESLTIVCDRPVVLTRWRGS